MEYSRQSNYQGNFRWKLPVITAEFTGNYRSPFWLPGNGPWGGKVKRVSKGWTRQTHFGLWAWPTGPNPTFLLQLWQLIPIRFNKPKEDLLKLRNKLQGPSTMLEERCPSLVAGPREGASLQAR